MLRSLLWFGAYVFAMHFLQQGTLAPLINFTFQRHLLPLNNFVLQLLECLCSWILLAGKFLASVFLPMPADRAIGRMWCRGTVSTNSLKLLFPVFQSVYWDAIWWCGQSLHHGLCSALYIWFYAVHTMLSTLRSRDRALISRSTHMINSFHSINHFSAMPDHRNYYKCAMNTFSSMTLFLGCWNIFQLTHTQFEHVRVDTIYCVVK